MENRKIAATSSTPFRLVWRFFYTLSIVFFIYTKGSLYKSFENNDETSSNNIPIKNSQSLRSSQETSREHKVINSIRHAWRGYAHYALDADELLPLSKTGQNNWGHLQWTLVDSLDSLYIAGLKEELQQARNHLAKASLYKNSVVSTFEMNIRLLGGTLSIYELTKDPLYLHVAETVGNKILRAFDTPTGIPVKSVHMIFGHPNILGWFQTREQSLVGAGTLQLELSHLSYLTKKEKYARAGRGAIGALVKAQRFAFDKHEDKGYHNFSLFPLSYNVDSGKVDPESFYFTMGGGADSFYEYLLKLYILEGGKDEELLNLYVDAMDDMIKYLVKDFDINGDTASILIDRYGQYDVRYMNHLACFVPGMLALGANYGMKNNKTQLIDRHDEHMQVSKQLMKTCVHFYLSQPSGLSAEDYIWDTYSGDSLLSVSKEYRLRPETVESLFILYRVTKDVQYREKGWMIFEAIFKHCKTEVAFAAVKNVTQIPVEHEDKMESFLISETLKYLQLLFADDDLFPLDKYVFTTEAHPLPIHY